jgi:hypothetical protein
VTGRSEDPPQAAASHCHCSVMASPQSGQGTWNPEVAVAGSSTSTLQPRQFHHTVVFDVSMRPMLNHKPVIFRAPAIRAPVTWGFAVRP